CAIGHRRGDRNHRRLLPRGRRAPRLESFVSCAESAAGAHASLGGRAGLRFLRTPRNPFRYLSRRQSVEARSDRGAAIRVEPEVPFASPFPFWHAGRNVPAPEECYFPRAPVPQSCSSLRMFRTAHFG